MDNLNRRGRHGLGGYALALNVNCEALEDRRLLSTQGSIDPTYGTAGFTSLPAQRPMGVETVASAAAPGGKTVLLGSAEFSIEPSPAFVLTRLNADGSPDTSFGPDGIILVTGSRRFQINMLAPTALAVDPQGRIYVAGFYGVVCRMNSDGTIDATFGQHGRAGAGIAAQTLAVEADGSILVGGYAAGRRTYSSNRQDFAVARLSSSGQLDRTFGRYGVAVAAFSKGGRHVSSIAYSLAVQGDGQILAAGGEDGYFDLARFNSNGTLDTTFGTGGEVRLGGDRQTNHIDDVFGFGVGGPWFDDVTVDPTTGDIFAAGGAPYEQGGSTHTNPLIIGKFTPDGRLDDAFGGGGVLSTSFTPVDQYNVPQAMVTGINVLSDGKLLVTGFLSDPSVKSGVLLARLNANGSADPTFAQSLPAAPAASADLGFKLITAVAPISYGGAERTASMWTQSPLIKPDGSFTLTFSGGPGQSPYDEANAYRFNADGSFDTSFGNGGLAVTGRQYADTTRPSGMYTAADGSTYVSVSGERQSFLERLLPDGTIDSSFSIPLTGRSTQNNYGVPDGVSVVAVQSDGKLLVQVPDVFNSTVDLSRYNADGSIDASFGNGGSVHFTTGSQVPKLLLRPDGSMVLDCYSPPLYSYGATVHTLYALSAGGQITGTYDVPGFSFWGLQSEYVDFGITPQGQVILARNVLVSQLGLTNLVVGLRVFRLDGIDLSTDATFGQNGAALLPGASDSGPDTSLSGTSVTVESDGDLLVGSYTQLMRLTPAGLPDNTFGTGGAVPDAIANLDANPGDVLVQSDGKILVETVVNENNGVPGIARLNVDGSLDTSFGNGGTEGIPGNGIEQHRSVFFSLQEDPAGERLLVADTANGNPSISHDPHYEVMDAYVAAIQL